MEHITIDEAVQLDRPFSDYADVASFVVHPIEKNRQGYFLRLVGTFHVFEVTFLQNKGVEVVFYGDYETGAMTRAGLFRERLRDTFEVMGYSVNLAE